MWVGDYERYCLARMKSQRLLVMLIGNCSVDARD